MTFKGNSLKISEEGDYMFACTFIGHKDFSQKHFEKLYIEVENLILFKDVRVFYVGTNGAFDNAVYRVLCNLRENYNIEIKVMVAYLNQKSTIKYLDNETIFPSVLEKTPLKYAISKRNMYMIDESQYMICYLNHTFSNSYTFVKYALSHKLQVINIGNFDINRI